MLNLNYQSMQAAGDEHHFELNLHAILVSGTSVLSVSLQTNNTMSYTITYSTCKFDQSEKT